MRPARPYLLGGGASGALLIGTLAAFASLSALVSRPTPPPSVEVAQNRTQTVTVPAAKPPPAAQVTGRRAGAGISAGPLSIAVPTSGVTSRPGRPAVPRLGTTAGPSAGGHGGA